MIRRSVETHTPPQIVPAGPPEVEKLAALHALAFKAAWDATALRDLLASPLVFAQQAGSPPLGFILARAVADEAEVLTLAVAPAGRRRGAGRALVEAAAEEARIRGAHTLTLEVAQDNVAALALYAATGFEEVGRRRGYYTRPNGAVDALTLQRRLNSAPA